MPKPAILLLCIIFVWLSACSQLPKDYERTETQSVSFEKKTTLARLLHLKPPTEDETLSSFHLIDRNEDALMWRLSMIETAQKTLDVQSYLWGGDSGEFLLDRLLAAADRGVRVRILIDDLVIKPGDGQKLASLNLHPNFEIRLFNPIKYRGKNFLAFWLTFAVNLDSLNMRMHNKLFIADNQVGIIGGRNIGDDYFGLHKSWNFLDTDLLCTGPIVTDMSNSFDLFWNYPQSYPLDAMAFITVSQKKMKKIREKLKKKISKMDNLKFFKGKSNDSEEHLKSIAGKKIPGKADLLYDTVTAADKKWNDLQTYLQEAKEEIVFISPYLTPTEEMLQHLEAALKAGGKITIFTNSLATNDHIWLNAIFKKHRERIVEMGVNLYELRHDGEIRDKYDTPPIRARRMALHSKVILLDKNRVYVGSLNMDHRAWYLNTEIGVIVESPALNQKLHESFQKEMSPANAWHVTINERGQLQWRSNSGVQRTQPAGGFWRRIFDDFLTDMPKSLERQL